MKKNPKIESLKGVAASVLVLLVASGMIDSKLSAAVTGVIAAALTLYAAFAVKPPKRKKPEASSHDTFGGSA
ncbi:MAG: hypothetical protein FGM36_16205 [Burkholderiaceae bacterium]|nr:hypothetical protein [Burkholderiaceae bacterium]